MNSLRYQNPEKLEQMKPRGAQGGLCGCSPLQQCQEALKFMQNEVWKVPIFMKITKKTKLRGAKGGPLDIICGTLSLIGGFGVSFWSHLILKGSQNQCTSHKINIKCPNMISRSCLRKKQCSSMEV